jgi:Protein of unknown function (DUF3500)
LEPRGRSPCGHDRIGRRPGGRGADGGRGGGLPLAAQRPAQQRLAHQLIATGLPDAGYVTVATIIGLDNVLNHVEG